MPILSLPSKSSDGYTFLIVQFFISISSVTSFMPFTTKKELETQEPSKLRIIPNVSDIKSVPASFTPTQTSQEEISRPTRKDVITCKKCGTILSSDYQFCNKCGTPL